MVRYLISVVCLASIASCAARPGPPTVRLEPCGLDDGPADASCGRVPVWENRTTRTGRRIDLKVTVLPALMTTAASPLFVLTGGPGQGAAAQVDIWAPLLTPIQRDRDVVLVDLRGTGASHPLECDDDPGAITRNVGGAGASLDRIRQCLSAYRDYADVTQYTTVNAMDDLDEVRASLGYSTIDLYGVSYGTRAALVYLARHAAHVSTVVLDSVAPPENRLPFFLARDAQRAFNLLVRDCDGDTACHSRFPELRVRFERLLTSLAAAPARVHVRDRMGADREVVVTDSRVASVVLAALYVPELSANLPLLLDQAERGEFSGLLALEDVMAPLRASVAMGLQHAVLCSEDVSSAAHDTIPSAQNTFLGARAIDAAKRLCSVWPIATVGETPAQSTPSDVPALLISGELDPVTPPEWAEVLAQRWPRSQHLIVRGSSHNASASRCVINAVARFLRTGGPLAEVPCITANRRPNFVLDSSGPVVGMEQAR